jgi:hypothetical protein
MTVGTPPEIAGSPTPTVMCSKKIVRRISHIVYIYNIRREQKVDLHLLKELVNE